MPDSIDTACNDSVVESIVAAMRSRSRIGQLKYGTTLDREDLDTKDWIQHAQEELMDAILYLERLKRQFSTDGKKYD